MYLLIILPSVIGLPFIMLLKTFTNIYFGVYGVFKLLGLGIHPTKKAYIWTPGNVDLFIQKMT
jgi:hypothetical protein